MILYGINIPVAEIMLVTHVFILIALFWVLKKL
jgi:hypothetical protein